MLLSALLIMVSTAVKLLGYKFIFVIPNSLNKRAVGCNLNKLLTVYPLYSQLGHSGLRSHF